MIPGSSALDAMLREFGGRVGGIRYAVIAASDGFPIAHTLPPGLPDGTGPEVAAAMVAATQGLARRLVTLLGDATVDETTIACRHGCVLSFPIGGDAVLAVFTDPTADVAAVVSSARRLAGALAVGPVASDR